MNSEQKAVEICELIFKHTMPKDQFGFYTEQDMFQDVLSILQS